MVQCMFTPVAFVYLAMFYITDNVIHKLSPFWYLFILLKIFIHIIYNIYLIEEKEKGGGGDRINLTIGYNLVIFN